MLSTLITFFSIWMLIGISIHVVLFWVEIARERMDQITLWDAWMFIIMSLVWPLSVIFYIKDEGEEIVLWKRKE